MITPMSIVYKNPFALPAAVLACATAPLLAYNLTPSATLFNQLLALAGGGLLLLSMRGTALNLRFSPAVLALLLLFVAPWMSHVWAGLPLSLMFSSSGLMCAALLLRLAGQGRNEPARLTWFDALCWGLLAAGLLSLGVSLIQVFMPAWADGQVIARSGIPGRAVGNMRQPNHLASLLMWSCVAAVYLADQGRFKRLGGVWMLSALLSGLVLAVVLSASRTGMLGVLILAAWGALDRKLA